MVRLGPNLTPDFNPASIAVPGSVTISNATMAGVVTRAPFDGRITFWRIRDASAAPSRCRFSTTAGSAPGARRRTPSPGRSPASGRTYPVDLPIEQGDLIALKNRDNNDTIGARAPAAGSEVYLFSPGLAENAAPVAPFASSTASNVAVNATMARNCIVPNVQGRRLKRAKRMLRSAGCRTGRVTRLGGVNTVVAQGRRPGRELPPGTRVRLTVGEQ